MIRKIYIYGSLLAAATYGQSALSGGGWLSFVGMGVYLAIAALWILRAWSLRTAHSSHTLLDILEKMDAVPEIRKKLALQTRPSGTI